MYNLSSNLVVNADLTCILKYSICILFHREKAGAKSHGFLSTSVARKRSSMIFIGITCSNIADRTNRKIKEEKKEKRMRAPRHIVHSKGEHCGHKS